MLFSEASDTDVHTGTSALDVPGTRRMRNGATCKVYI